ncbi:hypothetical protein MBANPS3_000703 [Mucor bainieri]
MITFSRDTHTKAIMGGSSTLSAITSETSSPDEEDDPCHAPSSSSDDQQPEHDRPSKDDDDEEEEDEQDSSTAPVLAGNVPTADGSAPSATERSPWTWKSTVRDAFDSVHITAYLASHSAPLNANNVKTTSLLFIT